MKIVARVTAPSRPWGCTMALYRSSIGIQSVYIRNGPRVEVEVERRATLTAVPNCPKAGMHEHLTLARRILRVRKHRRPCGLPFAPRNHSPQVGKLRRLHNITGRIHPASHEYPRQGTSFSRLPKGVHLWAVAGLICGKVSTTAGSQTAKNCYHPLGTVET